MLNINARTRLPTDFIKKKYAKQLLIKPEILKLEDIVTEEEKI